MSLALWILPSCPVFSPTGGAGGQGEAGVTSDGFGRVVTREAVGGARCSHRERPGWPTAPQTPRETQLGRTSLGNLTWWPRRSGGGSLCRHRVWSPGSASNRTSGHSQRTRSEPSPPPRLERRSLGFREVRRDAPGHRACRRSSEDSLLRGLLGLNSSTCSHIWAQLLSW